MGQKNLLELVFTSKLCLRWVFEIVGNNVAKSHFNLDSHLWTKQNFQTASGREQGRFHLAPWQENFCFTLLSGGEQGELRGGGGHWVPAGARAGCLTLLKRLVYLKNWQTSKSKHTKKQIHTYRDGQLVAKLVAGRPKFIKFVDNLTKQINNS